MSTKGQISKKRTPSLVGQRFGKWTVIEELASSRCEYRASYQHRIYYTCKCDCGNFGRVDKHSLSTGNSKSCGCGRKESNSKRSGANSPVWKGGRYLDDGGYIRIRKYGYAGQTKSGYIREHIYIMEQHLGRQLYKGETVHHKNGIKIDNRLENLELWANNHSNGQRVEDQIEWAIQVLQMYAPEKLNHC